MKPRNWLLKVAALASSLLLAGTYVYVQAGGTLWRPSAAPVPDNTKAIMQGTKRAPMVIAPESGSLLNVPRSTPQPAPNQPALAPVSAAYPVTSSPQRSVKVLASGTKSTVIFSPTSETGKLVVIQHEEALAPQPSLQTAHPAVSQQPTAPPQQTRTVVMPGSKSFSGGTIIDPRMLDATPYPPPAMSPPVQRQTTVPNQQAIPYQQLAPQQMAPQQRRVRVSPPAAQR